MADKNRAFVRVHGLEYTILGTESPDYMQSVAQYVSRRMDEIEQHGRIGEQRLATLTAINIADELFKVKEDMASLRRELLELQQTLRTMEKEKRNRV